MLVGKLRKKDKPAEIPQKKINLYATAFKKDKPAKMTIHILITISTEYLFLRVCLFQTISYYTFLLDK